MQGEKREEKAHELYVGFSEARVIAICPDQDGLELLGLKADKEPEYLKEKEGVATARIDVHFEDVKKGIRFKKSFFLENQPVSQKVNEDWDDKKKEEFVPKTQYVNQVGDSAWEVDEKDLPQKFTKFQRKENKEDKDYVVYGDKRYRVAIKGEADLMDFCRKWLAGVDTRKVTADFLLDMKQIFKGNFKELQEQVGGELAKTTVELLEVRTVEGEDGINQYQSVYKTSLPGYIMKTLRTQKFTEANIEKWKGEKFHKTENPDGRYLKNFEKFAIDITGEYGSKNYFELVPVKLYEESEDTVGKGNPEPTPAGSDY